LNKRKLFIILCSVIFSLILASCSKDQTNRFQGESDNWKGLYLLKQNEDNSEYGEGSLVYKGKEKLKKVVYKVEGDYGTMDGSIEAPEDGKITLNDSCSGCMKQSSNTPFHVTIEWNSHKETFDLKNNQK